MPSLDASGNKMRTWKLINVNEQVINPNTKQKMNIKMVNCRVPGSKFNLCSLTKMIDSGWKMSRDTTGIYLSKDNKTIHFNKPITIQNGLEIN